MRDEQNHGLPGIPSSPPPQTWNWTPANLLYGSEFLLAPPPVTSLPLKVGRISHPLGTFCVASGFSCESRAELSTCGRGHGAFFLGQHGQHRVESPRKRLFKTIMTISIYNVRLIRLLNPWPLFD